MASKKITAMVDLAGGQVSTDLATIVDVSAIPANQNAKSTLNDLFAFITKNITDGAVRFSGTFAPAVSGANAASLFFNDVTDTFQGSRNGSAYQNLLFGTGSDQQVTVFDSPSDTVIGFSTFTFNESTVTLTLASAGFANIELTSTIAAIPSRMGLFGDDAQIQLKAFGFAPLLEFYTGISGPAFPGTGVDIGQIVFGVTNTGTFESGNSGLATITVTTTEPAVGGLTGVGFAIATTDNGNVFQKRIVVNSTGTVVLGNDSLVSATLGTVSDVVLGVLTTYDNNASIQIGNSSTGPTTQKTLVIQANPSQANSVIELQASTGAATFLITALGTHVFAGATGVSISGAGFGRIYFDSGLNTFRVSENGGAYVNMVGGGAAGNVGGPASSTDNAIARWDGTSGNLIQNSLVIIDDSGNVTGAGTIASAAHIITSNAASAFAVGPNGDTNPAFRVVGNVASAATGLSLTSNAAAAGVTLTVLSSGVNENLSIIPKGTGQLLSSNHIQLNAASKGFYSGTLATAKSPPGLYLNDGATLIGALLSGGAAVIFSAASSGRFAIERNTSYANVGSGSDPWTFQVFPTTHNVLIDPAATFATSDPAAQLAVQSGATTRISCKVTSLANTTVDLLQFNLNADDTATVANIATFQTNSNGTAATSFGSGFTCNLESSTTNDRNAVALQWVWADATDATRTADWVFLNVNSAAALAETFRITGNALPVWPNTVTAGGTTGNQTINKPSGTVNIAASGTTVTVTNSLVTANSIVFAVVRTNDTTATIKNVVPAAGSFVINLGTAATAEVSIGWFVINK